MNNSLIIFTNYYPFYKGEEYLESEIIFLAKKFEEVVIISTMANNNMIQTRLLPANVKVIKSGVSHSIVGKIRMTIFGSSRAFKNRKKYSLLKTDGNGSIINRLFSFYFESRSMYIYNELLKKIKKEGLIKFEKVTIYSYWLFITARLAIEFKNEYFQEPDILIVSRAHGYDVNEFANRLNFLPQREFLMNNLDKIFTVSEDAKLYLSKKYPEYKNKIDVRRLGTTKLDYNINEDTNDNLHIVSCSTVRDLKRIDLIVDALTIIESKGIDYKWTHIGDGPMLKEIKAYADQKVNSDKVTFTGYMENKKVLNWYKENKPTVFVNTSSSEGVPVSIMEAMSLGIPIIATNVGGTSEIIEDDITGYLLDKNCTGNDLATNIIRIMSLNNEKYRNMSRANFLMWDSKSNSKKLYEEFAAEISRDKKYI